MMIIMIIIKIVVIFHDFDYFITEMFLGHVASLHALGVDGFSAQFEQVPDDDDDDHGDNDLDDHGDDLHVMGLSICLDIFDKGPTNAINIIMIFMLRIIMTTHKVSLGKDAVLPSLIAGHSTNREKNRYNNVLPYDHTLVQLRL